MMEPRTAEPGMVEPRTAEPRMMVAQDRGAQDHGHTNLISHFLPPDSLANSPSQREPTPYLLHEHD